MVDLGVAKGRIEVDTSGLRRAGTVVQRESRNIEGNLDRVSTRGTKGFAGLGRSVGIFTGALADARGELAQFSAVSGAAFTAASAFGLKAADDFRLLQVRFEEITGSSQRAAETLTQIATAARNAGVPVRETQRAFAGLIPTLNAVGEDTSDYVDLVARLSTLNPAEGVEGAVFAIREALVSGGTDVVSLAERFNIPRKQLRELIAETGSFGAALDQVLTQQGATLRAAEANADSLRGALTRLGDEVKILFEGAFEPLLDGAISGINALTNAIQNTPPALLSIGVAATGVTAAVTGLGAAIGTVAAAQAALNAAITSQQFGAFAAGISNANKQSLVFSSTLNALAGNIGGLGALAQFGGKAGKGGGLFGGLFGGLTSGVGKTISKIVAPLRGAFAKVLPIVGKLGGALGSVTGFMSRLVSFALSFQGIIAAAVGILTGIGVVRLIGAVTGNQRLREFGLSDLLEIVTSRLRQFKEVVITAGDVLKQLTVIIVNKFLEIAENVNIGFERLFTRLSNVLIDVIGALQRFIGGFGVGIGTLLAVIGDLTGQQGLTDLGFGIGRAGNDLKIAGAETMQREALGVDEDAIRERYANLRQNITESLLGISDTVEGSGESIVQSIANSFITSLEQARERFVQNVLASFERDVELAQQRAQLLREGTVDGLQDRIDALNDEKAAIEEFLPQLQAAAQFSSDAADKLAEYRQRLGEIDQEFELIADVAPAAIKRAKQGIVDEFTETVSDIKSELGDEINDLNATLKDDLDQLNDDVASKQAEARKKETEAEEDYREDEQDALEEHRRTLAEINRTADQDVVSAAADLNATAVFNARQRQREETREQNQQFQIEQQQRAENLADVKEKLAEERAEIQRNYEQRRRELIESNRQQIAEARAQAQREIQVARQEKQQQLQDLQNFEQQRARIAKQGADATLQTTANFWDVLRKQARGAFNAVTSGGTSRSKRTPTKTPPAKQGAGTNIIQSGINKIRAALGKAPVFDNGGTMPNMGMAFLQAGEVVRTRAVAVQEERLMRAAANGASMPNMPINVMINGTNLNERELERAIQNGTEGAVRRIFSAL